MPLPQGTKLSTGVSVAIGCPDIDFLFPFTLISHSQVRCASGEQARMQVLSLDRGRGVRMLAQHASRDHAHAAAARTVTDACDRIVHRDM